MIPNKHPHTGPPGRIVTWGSPWHGPCQDGNVTLPNGQQMAYSQTDQGGSGGDTIVFRPPGTELPKRPPEWEEADAAAGREWRDYALITGRTTRCLYGKSLGKGHGCWLYAAPDGSRWLISISGMTLAVDVDFTVPWTRTFTATRFGDIAAGASDVGEWSEASPQEEHTTQVTLNDWQQAVPGKSGGDYAIDSLGSITSGKLWLEDASITGAHAVLMAGLAYPTEPINRRSLGFVEVSISGVPGVDWSVSLTVLKSRGQTLGAWVDTEDRTSEAQAIGITWAPLTYTEDGSASGSPPSCDGFFYTVTEPHGPVFEVDGQGFVTSYIGKLSFEVGFKGRIIAMCYLGENEFAEAVEMDCTTIGEFILEEPQPAQSGITVQKNEAGWDTISPQCEIAQVIGFLSVYTNRSVQPISGSSNSQVTLRMPGGVTRNSELASSAIGTDHWYRVDRDFPLTDHNYSKVTVTMEAGDRVTSYNERSFGDFATNHYWVTAGDQVFYSALSTYLPSLNTSLSHQKAGNDGFFADLLYLVPRPPGGSFISTSCGLSFFKTQLRRYSNKLFEFEAVEFFRLSDGSDQDLRTIQMGAAGTGGHETSTVITEDGQPVPAYGSHNPVTGEIRRAQSSPVIYV